MIRPTGATFLLVSCAVFAQPSPAPPALEVASVKLHDGPLQSMLDFSSSGSRVTWRTYPVISLITEAYNLKNFQISFASAAQMPGENIYYDIFAKAEGEAPRTRSEFRQMLQGILADRFQLRTHLEMREMPVYDLVVGKNGPKFKQSAAGAEFSGFGGVNGRNQSMKCTKADMGRLADAIGSSFFVDRPVLDKTGLTGFYDWRIEATPEFRINNSPDLSDISIFTAVQDQLGLKLEPAKEKVEVLVVDRLEKPSAN